MSYILAEIGFPARMIFLVPNLLLPYYVHYGCIFECARRDLDVFPRCLDAQQFVTTARLAWFEYAATNQV